MPAPQGEVLAWAARSVSAGARVVATRPLASQTAGPWLLDIANGATIRAVLRLGSAGDEEVRGRFATEVAALELAARNRLPAPRLLAVDLDGDASGLPAVLASALEGSSAIPPHHDPDRSRELGRAAAAIHAVTASPTAALPLRRRPLAGIDFDTEPPTARSAALLGRARDALATRQPPAEPLVFVHGDLWHGNTLWDGDRYVGAVDWDYAGVGAAGVDLGSLRCDAALMYGPPAADDVLAGWAEALGSAATDVAWWDTVAAVSSPPDVAEWLPAFHRQGRGDLDEDTVTTRRDAFLAAALDALS